MLWVRDELNCERGSFLYRFGGIWVIIDGDYALVLCCFGGYFTDIV
jgi:hypothetical protein